MRKIFTADIARTLRRLGAAMLFSATLAASAAGAHAEPLVTPAWLNSHLHDAKLVVLDVRSAIDGSKPETFAQGHIPGAVHSDYDKGGWRHPQIMCHLWFRPRGGFLKTNRRTRH